MCVRRSTDQPHAEPTGERLADGLTRGVRKAKDLASLSVDLPMAWTASTAGVVGVINGGAALLGAWIPLAGLMTLWLSLPGFLLSAVGLLVGIAAGRRGIRWPLRGLAVNGVALILPFISLMLLGFAAQLGWDRTTEEALRMIAEREAEAKGPAPKTPAPMRPRTSPEGATELDPASR